MLVVIAFGAAGSWCRADDDDDATRPQGRYGLFGLLDGRSAYGTDFYPEPLLADDGDMDRELRTSWFHAEGSGQQQDAITMEAEYSLETVTFEIDGGYERDVSYEQDDDDDPANRDTEQGWDSVDLAARCPVYQFVSDDGFLDNTVVAGISVGVPTHTAVSEPTELLPEAWDLLKLGDHLSLQGEIGYSMIIGSGEGSGQQTLEYAATLGYRMDLSRSHLPGITNLTPMLEIDGIDPVNKSDGGDDQLDGVVGCEIGFSSVSIAQPKLEIGYTFPIDAGARKDYQWGIVTSLILDF